MKTIVLYNRKKPVMEVVWDNGAIIRVNKILNKALLPVIMQYDTSIETINQWLLKRQIPRTREGLRELETAFPGACNYSTPKNYFSLTDQYWFKVSASQHETWSSRNFFTNEYESILGRAFFAPWKCDARKISKTRTPDLTTNGVLRKQWVMEDGVSYLYKAGSERFKQEPLSEVLASIIMKKLNLLPFVEYKMVIHEMRICSKCRNFVTEDTEFVPAWYVYNKEKRTKSETVYTHFLRMCDAYEIEGAKEFMDNMLVIDSVIQNVDRHLGNFGFIRSSVTGEFISFAPLFDSGTAYGASKNAKLKNSMIFKKEEKAAIKKFKKSHDLNFLKENEELYEIINNYPEISMQKKDEIIMRMKANAVMLTKKDREIDLEEER